MLGQLLGDHWHSACRVLQVELNPETYLIDLTLSPLESNTTLIRTAALPRSPDRTRHFAALGAITEEVDAERAAIRAKARAGQFAVIQNIHREFERFSQSAHTDQTIDVRDSRCEGMTITIAARVILAEQDAAARYDALSGESSTLPAGA